MYSSVRLSHKTQVIVNGNTVDVLNWGSGFFFNFFNTKESRLPAIVTNRHVAESMGDECTFNFARRAADGSPDLTNHIPVRLNQFDKLWISHPTVDLVVIPIGPTIADLEKQGKMPFSIALDQALIPTDEELKTLLPVEQVMTVGFPGLLWDDVHNLPVFHRGYTATAPYIDFQGRKEFLIDIATWPGASGSPVILFNDGLHIDRSGVSNLGGGLGVKLLGVVFGVAVQDVSGNVVIQNAPTQISANMSIPTNLGLCIRSSEILDFEPLLASRFHFTPPAGYKMRTT